MAKFRCQRQVSRVGGSSYIPMPRQALLDLRLFMGDWVEIELDTETHTIRIRPLQLRDVAPRPGPRWNCHDMVPDSLIGSPAPRNKDEERRQLVEVGE